VEALLKAYQEAGSFLEAPAPHLAATTNEPIREGLGTVIGLYKLLEQVGEGGFGVVFMAEQQEPIRRKVALKVLKPGMDTRQVVARFEAERQALALMDHPNIAKVLDGGQTTSGRPYFVMDLVKGLPITDYCDQAQLTPRKRLKLFVHLCQAVQHAHQKGIIHRDLKPSNVLVTIHDTTPVVKVIDFGVAKALGQELTDKTLFTGFAQMIGTPLYMSPEQAGQSGLDIDTRTDIYSLGVLLYELLTGTTPFDKERLRTAGYDEMRRIIREEEPAKPSTRISTLGQAAATVSANRQSDPRRLSRLCRGELDWIVMKALEKDRNRRYESASAFAADVQRYLHDEPVQACPPSAMYRFRKFARRNKRAVVTTAVVALAILLAVGTLGWAVRDRVAREDELTRERMERQAKVAGQVELILDEAERLQQEQKWPEALAAAQRAEALQAGAETHVQLVQRVQGLLTDLKMVQRLEEIRLQRSELKHSYFDYEAADRAYALVFREHGIDVERLPVAEAAKRIRSRPGVAVALAAALDNWAFCRRNKYDPQGARALTRVALEGARALTRVAQAADPDPWRRRMRTALVPKDRKALQALAATEEVLRQPAETLLMLAMGLRTGGQSDPGLEVLRKAQREHPGDFWLNFNLAISLQHTKPPRYDEAIAFYRAALAARPRNAAVHHNLGNVLYGQKKLDEAIACYRKAIQLQPDYALAHAGLGNSLVDKGELDEAIACCRKAIELQPDLAPAHDNLGGALRGKGLLDEAIAAYREAIRLQPGHANTHCNLGGALFNKGDLEGALAAYREAIRLKPANAAAHVGLGAALKEKGLLDKAIAASREAIRLEPDDTMAHNNLGLALHQKGLLDEAATAYREAIRLKPDNAEAHYSLGNALQQKGALDEAIAAYRGAIRLKPDYVQAHFSLGKTLRRKGLLDEAIAAYKEAIRLKPDYAKAHYNLAIALKQQGALDEAIAAYREAIRLEPDFAEAHCNLGGVLRGKAAFAESLAAYRRGHELGSRRPNWRYPSAQWVREAERLVELDRRLAAILRGQARPRDAGEQIELAQICYSKKLYAGEARFYAEAFAAEPKRAADLEAGHRYAAACAAALAGCGRGADVDKLDEAERGRWRRQALDWLRAHLTSWTKQVEAAKPEFLAVVQQRLPNWQRDPDLAGVRDPTALARLPKAERDAWLVLWADVEALLARVKPKGKKAPPEKP
jgi:tetratricopeptide (TPR) repeat protein